MRAVVFEQVGKVRVAEVPDAVIEEPDDAIVRVTRSAICGSDLHFYHGKAPMMTGEGIGHEAVGRIRSVGAGVSRFVPGDRVVVAFDIACGGCWFCLRGETHLCEHFRNLGAGAFGGGLPGAQADLVRVPTADVNLLPVPDGIDDERALFVGDVLTTGFFCIQAAVALGSGRVYALDLDPRRLALAERVGAVPVDVRRRNAEMALAGVTDGRGADVAIDAVGSPAAYESALDVVRRGGRVVVVGMYAGETVNLQLGVYWARALDVRFGGVCPVHAWWKGAMAEVVAGRIDPIPVISHRLTLDDAPRGYELFANREATKVVLLP